MFGTFSRLSMSSENTSIAPVHIAAERLAWVVLALCAIAAVWFGRSLLLVNQVILWCMLLFVLAILLRQGWLKLFGPVLFYDLIRTSRKGRYVLVRCLYGGFLACILGWVYLAWLPQLQQASAGSKVRDMANFAESFFNTFMIVQFMTVVLLTPAYTSGAITDEKERKTLEFILATDLSNREIVLSKLASRLANLTLIIITGLPILSFLQFLGGVDPDRVLAGFLATGVTMFSLAAFGLFNSVLARRSREALATTFLGVIGYLLFSGMSWFLLLPFWGLANWPSTANFTSPVTVEDLVNWINAGNIVAALVRIYSFARGGPSSEAMFEYLRDYVIFHLLVGLLFTTWSIIRLRVIALRQMEGASAGKRTKKGLPTVNRRPAVSDQPVLWKEMYTGVATRSTWMHRLVVMIIGILSFAPAIIIIGFHCSRCLRNDVDVDYFTWAVEAWVGVFLAPVLVVLAIGGVRSARGKLRLGMIFWGVIAVAALLGIFGYFLELGELWRVDWKELSISLGWWGRIAASIVGCLMLMGVAIRASQSIGVERDKQTIDALLTSPLSSDELLFGKGLGAILVARWEWLWLGSILGVGVLLGGIHPLAVPLFVGAWWCYACFFATLGLWYSAVSSTTYRATLLTLFTAGVVTLGHWMIWMCVGPFMAWNRTNNTDAFEWLGNFQLYGLTPPATLGLLAFHGWEFDATYQYRPRHNQIYYYMLCTGIGVTLYAFLTFALANRLRERFQSLTGRRGIRSPERLIPKSSSAAWGPVKTASDMPTLLAVEDVPEVEPVADDEFPTDTSRNHGDSKR